MKNSFDLQPFHSPKKLKIQTIGIGEYNVDFSSYNELLRFKCDKKNVALLIAKTWGLKQNWTVDFNGSLDETSWLKFTTESCLDKCLWIEQPFSINQITHRHRINTPIYADEDMQHLSLGKFIESPYNGFILKPLRHDFSDFLKWLHYARKFNIPCLIGSVVCDHVGLALCEFF